MGYIFGLMGAEITGFLKPLSLNIFPFKLFNFEK
jgi:hypothetical protein